MGHQWVLERFIESCHMKPGDFIIIRRDVSRRSWCRMLRRMRQQQFLEGCSGCRLEPAKRWSYTSVSLRGCSVFEGLQSFKDATQLGYLLGRVDKEVNSCDILNSGIVFVGSGWSCSPLLAAGAVVLPVLELQSKLSKHSVRNLRSWRLSLIRGLAGFRGVCGSTTLPGGDRL
ncbi:Hypothetical protein YALIH222_S08E02938G [Yarrowia lipolytica]|nr:Hypothetical protein YALIH222_S08E02938G [Yarrowia lipolytica]